MSSSDSRGDRICPWGDRIFSDIALLFSVTAQDGDHSTILDEDDRRRDWLCNENGLLNSFY